MTYCVMPEPRRGSIHWADLNPARGREQAGRRPVLVVASNLFLEQADALAIVLPVTTSARGWPNHVLLRGPHVGLDADSYAMTEQVRTIARERLLGEAGWVDRETMEEVNVWLRDFLSLP